tara:strand:+ start:55985 stop:60148 length:4164 start_codon:yes stop_codon:yes gene_type:complete
MFSTSGRDIPLRSSLLNIPLFVLSFLSLTLVLAWSSWQQYQQDKAMHINEVHLTLENYAQQAGLLAQAGIAANTMFVRGYADLIGKTAAGDPQASEHLWNEMQRSFFNITGYTLFDGEGHFLQQGGEQIHSNEIADIYVNINASGGDHGLFLLRYGGRGGFYFFSRFSTDDGKSYIFVSRRAYSKLSQIIYNGHFPGFEMLLIDTRTETVSIREFYFADSDNQPGLKEEEKRNILFRTSIPFSHWDVAALPVKDGTNPGLLQRLSSPLLVLLVFAILASILWLIMRRQERKARQIEAIRRQTEQRADRVLASVDDALISTDSHGVIDYVNPRGAALLIEMGVRKFVGAALSDVWPDKQALWNRGLSTEELEMLADSGRRMKITIGDEERILEQEYNPLYERRKICGIVWLLRDITDAEHVTRAMQQSQQRYKALFEESGVAHCVIDVSAFNGSIDEIKIVDVNDAAVRIAGADSREHLIANFKALNARPDKPQFAQSLQRALELDLATTEFDIRLKCFDGEVRDFWVNLSLHSGSAEHALMTLLDVTESKQANKQIREREAFWSSITASMPDVIYVLDIDEKLQPTLVYRNREVADLLGYPPEARQGKHHWIDYAPKAEMETIRNNIAGNRHMKPGETRQAQMTFIHYDGSERILKSQDTPLQFDEKGYVTRYIGSVRDVTDEVRKQQQVRDSERRYRLLAENINDVIWASDLNLNFNFVSASVERILGYKQDELLSEGVNAIFEIQDIRTMVHDMRAMLNKARLNPEKARTNKDLIKIDMMATSKQGDDVLLELQATTLWNEDNELQGILGICRDVTEARAIEQELRLAAEVFANSNEAIIITDNTMNIANANRAFCAITGYKYDDVIGRTPDFLISDDRHDITFYEKIGQALVIDGYWQGEIFYRCMDGEVRTGWAGVTAIRDDQHEVQSLIIIMSDITERKVIEERIHKLAYFDPLTGLPNRTQMHEKLDAMIRRAKSGDQCLALLFIDLDRFKPINDSMGHPAGDQVLKQVAQRLRECTKQDDLVCRMGGDEFTLALGGLTDADQAGNTAIKVAERILHCLNKPYVLQQREVFISASIGISIYPHDGESVIELLKNSDMAMYHAKNLGRDNVQFFDEKMNEKAVEMMELENDLRQAQSRNELELYFQPQYQARSGDVVGAEALLRWHHPDKGMISPAVFIPVIEDTGLIVPVGEWVLSEACRHFAAWQQQGLSVNRIAVNVSARQFKHDGFIDAVKNAITAAGIQPSQLELELTESILMDDVAHTLAALKSLRDIGVRTAIDDFGTGYSSLNYLKQFPVDILKIDRSFIQNLPQNADDAQITRTIIAMAHNLGMGVIAEGVETREQLEFLISADCEEVQGFLLSKPLPVSDLLPLLQSNSQQH